MSEPETIAMVEAAGLSISPVVTQKFRPSGPFGRDLVSRTVRLAVAKWIVAPGPVVSAIEVWALEPDADPPELKLKLKFAGRQRFDDPVKPDQETLFAGPLQPGPRRRRDLALAADLRLHRHAR